MAPAARIPYHEGLNAEKLKALLNLVPLSFEGGYYAETYRSSEMILPEYLQVRYSGPRSVGTAIYYLLKPNTFSELHRVASHDMVTERRLKAAEAKCAAIN